jgi:hypothetical protein
MKRWDIINRLIDDRGYKRYLEIGQQKGQCFREVHAQYKEGVDPKPKNSLGVPCKYIMTSDEFFDRHASGKEYDIVFIDGLHIREQVFQDINNSLRHLTDDGVIILHDCNPQEKWHQVTSGDSELRKHRRLCRGPNVSGDWNGDVWKAFLDLRRSRQDLNMYTIDTDCGCGVVERGKQNLYEDQSATEAQMYEWDYFDNNRKQILNLISVDQFKNKFTK